MSRPAAIPNFYLYGEPHRVADGRFVHIENLDDRCRPSEWTIRPHAHADLNHIFHIMEGGGAIRAEDAMVAFDAPCVLLVPAGVVHGFSWTSDSKGAVITVATAYLERLQEADAALGGLFDAAMVLLLDQAGSAQFETGTSRLSAELGWAAPGHRAAAEAGLLDILVRSLRMRGAQHAIRSDPSGRQAELVARFRARVEARFRLRESIAVHAAALNTSQTRLRSACGVIARRSPMQILDQRTLLEAQRLLLYTNLAVAEIAGNLGLPDAAYFSRFFTRHTGVPPRTYRNTHGGKAID